VRVLQATGGAALNTDEAPAAERVGARRRAVWVLAAVATLAVLVDQVTKQLTVAHLADAEPVRLLGGAVYLVHTTNSGAAFGIGESYTFVFPIVAVAVVGWIIWAARRLRSVPWGLALALVLGGAVGNLIDRILRPPAPLRGEVVDMISVFDPYGRVFPVFNAADSALVIGVAFAVWLELTGRRRDGTRVTGGDRARSERDGAPGDARRDDADARREDDDAEAGGDGVASTQDGDGARARGGDG
jgi:signal peptidase II